MNQARITSDLLKMIVGKHEKGLTIFDTVEKSIDECPEITDKMIYLFACQDLKMIKNTDPVGSVEHTRKIISLLESKIQGGSYD